MMMGTRARSLVIAALAGAIGCRGAKDATVPKDTDGNPPAAPEPSPIAAVLDTLVPAALKRAGAPGAGIALVENGEIKLARGYGLADREANRPYTQSTPMGVASVSKLVFSWGVMRLVTEGKLGLDQPVGPLVTGWKLPPSRFDPKGVTVRRLLSHTAGTTMLSVPCFPADLARPAATAVLSGTAGDRGRVELASTPGSKWSYSGGGFTLLQLAAERAAGVGIDSLMSRALFGPLGMSKSHYGPPPAEAAIGYDEDGKPVRPVLCVGEAAASLVTTPRDMAKLLAEYVRARRGTSKVLPDHWLDTLVTPVIKAALVVGGKPIDLGDARMALGHFVHTTAAGHPMVFHSGGNPGVAAYVVVDLDRGNGLFVVVNSDRARDVIRAVVTGWAAANRTDPPTFF